MSLGFNADQYNQAFDPKRLQNWEIPRCHREHPNAKEGYTQFIGNSKGHLNSDVKKSKESPWGTFVPTWDMPLRLPGAKSDNPTARTTKAHDLLVGENKSSRRVLCGKTKVPCDKAQATGQAANAKCPTGATIFPPEPVRSGAANPEPPSQMEKLPTPAPPPEPAPLPTPPKAMSPVPV